MNVKQTAREASTLADAIRRGDQQVLARIAAAPIIPRRDNLIVRPWAGQQLGAYKNLQPDPQQRWGEAFEICAFADDEEARAHPSIIQLADGSEIDLPELLAIGGPAILGEDFIAAYGCQFPLLPKTLDVGELLSLQAHPEGFTEAYIIIEAEAGATIRLGFKHDVDSEDLARRLKAGRQLQLRLLDHLDDNVDIGALQTALTTNFSKRDVSAGAVFPALTAWGETGSEATIVETLQNLKALYWEILDMLNVVPVSPGQIIYNANPKAVSAATGRPPSAEAHALGNPEGKGILALEIRRPGSTYRAWDHLRYPLRPIKVDDALDAFNLRATQPYDFYVSLRPDPERPGILRSIEDEWFVVDHLQPRPEEPLAIQAERSVRTLHAIRGTVALRTADGNIVASLSHGQSTLLPIKLCGFEMTTTVNDAEAVMVTLPASLAKQQRGLADERQG